MLHDEGGFDAWKMWAAGAAALLLAAATVAWPADAAACGGLFCNQRQPVNQADENIVFTANKDGTVTALIQIRYQGPSEKFAWMLPVFGTPDVGVSSSTIFQRLTRATQPSYNRNVEVEGECKSRRLANSAGGTGGATGGADAASAGRDSGPVNVEDRGSVGPYNYTTISVDKKAKDPAKKALKWLQDKGYDLTDTGPELIREYLRQNMNLIAFKLQKDTSSGDIRPVKLRYDHPLPMIPLKLTAVAAQDDMGVRVWVGGDARAVPTRFDAVKLNPAAINWFRWSQSYQQVVSQAADEVGGRGFVTEYAGDSEVADGSIFPDRAKSRWQDFDDPAKWQGREGELLYETIQTYWPRFGNSQWDGVPRVIRNEVPLPQDVSAREFLQQPRSVQKFDRMTDDIENFDPASYLEALDKNVVEPVREAEKLLQKHSYLTRLFTTVSPGEMTRDPTFELKEDLPDVERTHTAEQTIFCGDEDYRRFQAPWKMKLPDGTVVWGQGRQWPFSPGEINAAKKATSHGMTGDGEVVEDNSKEIEKTVEEQNETIDRPGSSGESGGSGNAQRSYGGGDDGCGCSATGGAAPAIWLAVLLGLGLVRLRRSRD